MVFVITPYAAIAAITAGVALIVAWVAWQRRRVAGGASLAGMMAAVSIWSAGAALEYATVGISGKVFWAKLEYIGVLTCPVFYLLFALEYNRLERWLTRRTVALLFAVPLLTLVLTFTNEWHKLIWPSVTPSSVGDNLAVYGHGIGFWLGTVGYAYLLMLIATFLFVRGALRLPAVFQRQVALIIIAVLAPWVVNVIYLLGLSPAPGLELTPLVLVFSGMIFAWAIFGFQLLSVAPIARQTLIETMAEGMLVLDVEDQIVEINPAAQRLVGAATPVKPGQPVSHLLPAWPDWEERFWRRGQTDAEIELDGATPRDLKVTVTPLRNRRGNLIGRLVAMHDITARRRAETALRRQNDYLKALQQTEMELAAQMQREKLYFESLLTNSPAATAIIDLDGRIVSWNPAAEALFGYTEAEAIGREADALVAADESVRREAQEYTHRTFAEGLVHAFTRRTCKDGAQVDVELRAVPVVVHGEAVGALAIYHDITELQQARQTAEAAARVKGEFLANMSHELRTPLNAILGFADLLAHDTTLTPAQRENAAIIGRSGKHLLGLINDVLDMAKLEAGRATLHEAAFDLHQLLDDLVELFQERALAKSLSLQLVREQVVCRTLYADELKLRQVLINLLGNAVKFSAAGAVIITVQTPCVAGDCRFICTVQDSGPGIAPDEQALIFEPFVQAAHTSAHKEGTGLGLPISRQFARLMGGDITVVSTGIPGEGSLFRLEVPVRCADDAGQPAPQGQPLPVAAANVAGAQRAHAPAADADASRRELPGNWIDLMRTAATAADASTLRLLAAQLAATQPELAAALCRWIDAFDYDAIQQALEEF